MFSKEKNHPYTHSLSQQTAPGGVCCLCMTLGSKGNRISGYNKKREKNPLNSSMLAKHKDEKASVQQGALMRIANDTAGNVVLTYK